MKDRIFTSAIIVAAGKGRRMGTQISKQFIKLGEKEILAHTVDRFEKFSAIEEIILVTGKDSIDDVCAMVTEYHWEKVKAVVIGGKERQDSVKCGLDAISNKAEIVFIHDGVRPFVTEQMIQASMEGVVDFGGCVVGMPVKDTIKVCDKNAVVIQTPDRSGLWQIQTPQTFRRDLIDQAYKKATNEGFEGTDDASVAEFYGIKIKVIEGSYQNIKITTKEDLLLAACFLEEESK